jgi:hypothetical protein
VQVGLVSEVFLAALEAQLGLFLFLF